MKEKNGLFAKILHTPATPSGREFLGGGTDEDFMASYRFYRLQGGAIMAVGEVADYYGAEALRLAEGCGIETM